MVDYFHDFLGVELMLAGISSMVHPYCHYAYVLFRVAVIGMWFSRVYVPSALSFLWFMRSIM